MGHTDERMVMRIYDHLTDKREAAAIALLNDSYANDMQKPAPGVLRAL